MQSGILSTDGHKTKILVNLTSTEDPLHLQHHTPQDFILYVKAQNNPISLVCKFDFYP